MNEPCPQVHIPIVIDLQIMFSIQSEEKLTIGGKPTEIALPVVDNQCQKCLKTFKTFRGLRRHEGAMDHSPSTARDRWWETRPVKLNVQIADCANPSCIRLRNLVKNAGYTFEGREFCNQRCCLDWQELGRPEGNQ